MPLILCDECHDAMEICDHIKENKCLFCSKLNMIPSDVMDALMVVNHQKKERRNHQIVTIKNLLTQEADEELMIKSIKSLFYWFHCSFFRWKFTGSCRKSNFVHFQNVKDFLPVVKRCVECL